MLSIELLQALDDLIWLGSEAQAAELSHCNQSTICRRAKQAAKIFSLHLIKINHEWRITGPSNLLTLERHVHQLYRFQSNSRLRVESDHWVGQRFATCLPGFWIHGKPRRIGIDKPMRLLRERVIDAWISSTISDLPATDDPTYQVYQLAQMPVEIACATDHPLVHSKQLSRDDLLQFPSLALPSHLYPNFSIQMRSKGLWTETSMMRSYAFGQWEARAMGSLTTIPTNVLSTHANAKLTCLDFDIGINDCFALVARRDMAEQAAVQALLETLQRWLAQEAIQKPALAITA
jgi:DNA-binding transcriptional LysR family regulator